LTDTGSETAPDAPAPIATAATANTAAALVMFTLFASCCCKDAEGRTHAVFVMGLVST